MHTAAGDRAYDFGFFAAGCSCRAAGEFTVSQRGEYVYMHDLRVLCSRRPPADPVVPDKVGVVNSLLVAGELETALSDHPNREFVVLVVGGNP